MFLDQVMGSDDRPSLMDEVTAVKQQVADHIRWHGQPGNRPAGPDLSKPNSPTGRRR
jgi:hypothetical protein